MNSLKNARYATLLLLFGALLFNNLPKYANESSTKTEKSYFISASNHLNGLTTDDDHTNPADNEEDEDEDDDEDRAESLDSKSCQEFIVSTLYHIHQERLFCDPLGELISPPPKI